MQQQQPIDLQRARAETPGVEHVVHLNNCGAGLMPAPVLDAVIAHLRLEAQIGGYEAAARAGEQIARAYGAVAEMLGCAADEIALVENATVGWRMAFYSVKLGAGDRILTSMAEYASNYIAYLQVARDTGAEIVVVPNDEAGQLDVKQLERLVDARTKLISITHVPTGGGLVNPAAEIGAVARAAGVPYLLDACQSAGQMPLDVARLGCDMLSATSRKFLRGPRGVGVLYVRRELLAKLEPPMLDLHAASWTAEDRFELRPDARRFENWESYVAGRIGFGVAVSYATRWGLPAIERRVHQLAATIRHGLRQIHGVRVHDRGERLCGIVSFTVGALDPVEVKSALGAAGINIATSDVSSTRLEMEQRQLTQINRLGVHYYNSEEEVARLLDEVERLVRAR